MRVIVTDDPLFSLNRTSRRTDATLPFSIERGKVGRGARHHLCNIERHCYVENALSKFRLA